MGLAARGLRRARAGEDLGFSWWVPRASRQAVRGARPLVRCRRCAPVRREAASGAARGRTHCEFAGVPANSPFERRPRVRNIRAARYALRALVAALRRRKQPPGHHPFTRPHTAHHLQRRAVADRKVARDGRCALRRGHCGGRQSGCGASSRTVVRARRFRSARGQSERWGYFRDSERAAPVPAAGLPSAAAVNGSQAEAFQPSGTPSDPVSQSRQLRGVRDAC